MLRAESKPAVFEPPLHQRSGLQRFFLFCLRYSLTVFFICTTAQVFLMHISWATNKLPNTSYRFSFKFQRGFGYHQAPVHHAAMETQHMAYLQDHHRITSCCKVLLLGEHQDPYLTRFIVRILEWGTGCLETTQFCASEGQAKQGGCGRLLGELGKFLWPGKHNRKIPVLFHKSEVQQLVIGFETKDEVRDQFITIRNLLVTPVLCTYSSQHALHYLGNHRSQNCISLCIN